MRSILFAVLFVSFSFSLFSQKLTDPVYSYQKSLTVKLKDNHVKTRKITVHYFDEKGQSLPEKQLMKISEFDSLRFAYTETVYDQKDTITYRFVFNKHNDLKKYSEKSSDLDVRETIKYDYDKDGVLLREFSIDGDQKVMFFKEYNYTENELNISIFDDKGRLAAKQKMVYDPLNSGYNIISVISGGKFEFQKKIVMNDSGRIAQCETIKDKDNLSKREIYTYDDSGNRTEILITDKSGKPLKKIVNKYNEKGLLIRSTLYEPLDKQKRISKYTYDYFIMNTD